MKRLHPAARRLLVLGILLATGALLCQLAFHLIGSHVDRQGVLREPFALKPTSALMLLSSGLALTGAWVRQQIRRP